MADYKAMYLRLFNAITVAVKILERTQAEAEEIYISHKPNIIKLQRPDGGGDDNA